MSKTFSDYECIITDMVDPNSSVRHSLPNTSDMYEIFRMFTRIRGQDPIQKAEDFQLLSKIDLYFQTKENHTKELNIQRDELGKMALKKDEVDFANRLFQAYQNKPTISENIVFSDVYFGLVGRRSLINSEYRRNLILNAKPYGKDI